MKKLCVLFLMLAAAPAMMGASAQYPTECTGTPNPFPVFTEEPTFVRSVKNGKLYSAGTGTDTFQVVHLWGNAYEKGYAQGQLLKEAVVNVSVALPVYIEAEAEKYLPWLPKSVVDGIIEYGIQPMLLLNWDVTQPFMTQDFIDEINGIADGSGVDVSLLKMLNMFPELTRAACSIVGANKAATPNGLLNQLRALDIGPDIPIKDQAQVTIYHSNDGASQTYMTVGWTAMIGALTGFSAQGVGIGEKVWYSAPESVWSMQGEPWMFVLRNVLERTTAMPQALNLIQNSNRTCGIHVGLGTAFDNEFRGLIIAAKEYSVYNDTSINYTPGHPAMPGLVYWDKHVQPSKSECLPKLLQQFYGNVTANNLATLIAPISQTGDFHTVTFDYNNQYAYIANSRKTYVTEGSDAAYDRQFTRVNMTALFIEQAP